MHERVGVLGVVLEQQAVRREGVEDAVAQGVAQLGVGHAAVQRQRGDEHDVVDAGFGGELEHLLDHQLAYVGAAHGRQGQRDVVEGDGERHPRAQLGPQRRGVAERVLEGVADGADGVLERVDRLGRVQDPAAHREALEAEPLAVPEQRRRCRAVNLEDEAGPRAHGCSPFVRVGRVPL